MLRYNDVGRVPSRKRQAGVGRPPVSGAGRHAGGGRPGGRGGPQAAPGVRSRASPCSTAAGTAGIENFALLMGQYREPRWPAGVVGSVTHTDSRVRRGGCGQLALRRSRHRSGARRAARAGGRRPHRDSGELAAATNAGLVDSAVAARLLFSAKEAVYKCQFPVTGRRLAFADVTVAVEAGGSFRTNISSIEGRWMRTDGLLFTAAWWLQPGRLCQDDRLATREHRPSGLQRGAVRRGSGPVPARPDVWRLRARHRRQRVDGRHRGDLPRICRKGFAGALPPERTKHRRRAEFRARLRAGRPGAVLRSGRPTTIATTRSSWPSAWRCSTGIRSSSSACRTREIIDGEGRVVTDPDPELLASARGVDLTDVADDGPSVRFRNLILSEHQCLDTSG